MVSFVQTWWIIARPILATWYGMYDVYGTARDCGFWWCVWLDEKIWEDNVKMKSLGSQQGETS